MIVNKQNSFKGDYRLLFRNNDESLGRNKIRKKIKKASEHLGLKSAYCGVHLIK